MISSSSAPTSRSLSANFYILFSLIVLLRLAYLFAAPFDLFPDEAYYWDWSRVPDWGYYSKPPMVAWLIAAATRTFGQSAVAVRLPALLLGSGAVLTTFLLARRMFDERTAFWSGVLLLAMPLNATLTLFMTTDAPLSFCWAGALYCGWRWLRDERRNAWWVAVALFIGFGTLSKQMMLVFIPILAVYFAWNDRQRLRQPEFYLMSLIGLAFLTPMLAWNASHDWITVHHTAHHFEKARRLFIVTVSEFAGSQLLVVTPVTVILIFTAAWQILRRKDSDVRLRYLLLFGPLPLTIFLLMSFRQKVNPNWPTVYYFASAVLAVAWFRRNWVRWNWIPRAAAVGAVLAATTYLMPWIAAAAGIDGGKLDVTLRMKGWKSLAAAVEEERRNAAYDFVMAVERQGVGELAFYLPGQPRVYRWPGSDGIVRSQYEIWGIPPELMGHSALIVLKADRPPQDLIAAFEKVTFVKELKIVTGTAGSRTWYLFRGDRLRSWPKMRGSAPEQ